MLIIRYPAADESSKRKNSENEMPQKSLPKKPCTAYVMFSKQMWKSIIKENPYFTMHEVNSVVSEMWKQVGNEDHSAYRQKALENYERRLEHQSINQSTTLLKCQIF